MRYFCIAIFSIFFISSFSSLQARDTHPLDTLLRGLGGDNGQSSEQVCRQEKLTLLKATRGELESLKDEIRKIEDSIDQHIRVLEGNRRNRY